MNKYSFLSGNDVPADRDPNSWTVDTSLDGVTWRRADNKQNYIMGYGRPLLIFYL
jgi:hypothetical protein